jgi:N-acetylglucosaminyldiphosphoundecaprenol N-acetyl-beta-D-mannosaminyltransferase
MPEAVEAVLALTGGEGPELVVTPNVDHVVILERSPEFAAAYECAALRVADGAPLVFLSRLLGSPLPERVTGVDLTRELIARCEETGRSVFFFGGSPAALSTALERVRVDHPRLSIAGAVAPTIDLDQPTDDEAVALDTLRAARPALVFVFLGAPKQERWFLRRRHELPPAVFLAVGGTVDFLGGSVRRAPKFVQSIGFEWLWRLVQEPRRLFRRYVIDDSRFLFIAARELRTRWPSRR